MTLRRYDATTLRRYNATTRGGGGRLTLHFDGGALLDVAELRRGDARVRRRLVHVLEDEHVASDRHAVLGRQLDGAETPLDERHRRADGDARHVDGAARQQLHVLRRDREDGRHAAHCNTRRRSSTSSGRRRWEGRSALQHTPKIFYVIGIGGAGGGGG